MATTASLPTINTAGLTLLMYSEEKFRLGDTRGALEDFQAASAVIQKEVINKIYWHIWDLSKRPFDVPNFGEDAMFGRLVSLKEPDNLTKAEAIRLAVVKYHLDTVAGLQKRLKDVSKCLISLDEMKDPVIDFDGHTYDRLQIQEHYRQLLRAGKIQAQCPHSRSTGSTQLIPNYSVQEIVAIYREFGMRLGHLAMFVQTLYDENKKLQTENETLKREKSFFESRQIQPEQELILSQFQSLVKQNAERDHLLDEQFRVWGEERRVLTEQIAELRELQISGTREQIRMTEQLSEGHRRLSERQEQLTIAQRQLSERQLQLINLQRELESTRSVLVQERQTHEVERSDSQKILQSYSGMDFCQRFTFLITGQ